MIENLDKIKIAIDVEIKHRYIDIRGKTQSFSSFIKNEAKKLYKATQKNPRWAVIIEIFEHYPFASLNERRKSIDRLIKVIKSEIQTTSAPLPEINDEIPKNPNEVDVMYVKGVGPKIAYKLNKLGIYTANDLMCYFPKKHIDYSSRTLIKTERR